MARGKKKRVLKPADSSEDDDDGAHKLGEERPAADSSDEEQAGLAALAVRRTHLKNEDTILEFKMVEISARGHRLRTCEAALES